MVGTLVAMMAIVLGMAISRYVPKNVILQIKHIIPQSFFDNFKRDPLGTLKNIKIPTNLDQLRDMIPEKLFNQEPTIDKSVSNVTAPDPVQHLVIAPPPPPPQVPEPTVTPPLDEHVRHQVLELPVSPPPAIDHHTLTEDTGIIVHRPEPFQGPVLEPPPPPPPLPEDNYVMPGQIIEEQTVVPNPAPIQLNMVQLVSAIKAPSRTSSSILQINTEDLAAVRAFLDAKGTTHNVLA